jgi:hypothetical protein
MTCRATATAAGTVAFAGVLARTLIAEPKPRGDLKLQSGDCSLQPWKA